MIRTETLFASDRRWLAVVALTLGLNAAGVAAARADWTLVGPGEGTIESVVASSRGDFYVVSRFGDLAEVYRLAPGASAWQWRNQGLGRPQVRALAVHPRVPHQLWAVSGAEQRVYGSADGGATWRSTGSIPDAAAVSGLWVVPTRPVPVLLAQTGAGPQRRLLRSADGGASWTAIPDAAGPVGVAADQPGLVYAGYSSGGDGLLRSNNGGATFRRVPRVGVPAGDELRSLVVTDGRQPVVIAAFAAGGLRINAGGKQWERERFYGAPPSALATRGGKVYVIAGFTIYASHRRGAAGTFREVAFVHPRFLPNPIALAIGGAGLVFLGDGDLFDLQGVPLAETGMAAFGGVEVRIAEADATLRMVRILTSCLPRCDRHTFYSYDGGARFVRLGAYTGPGEFVDVLDFAFDASAAERQLWIFGFTLWLKDFERGRFLDPEPFPELPGVGETVEIAARANLLAGGEGGIRLNAGAGTGPWQAVLASPPGFALRIVDLRVDAGAPEGVVALGLRTALDPSAPPTLMGFRSVDAGATWSAILDGAGGVLDVEAVPGSPTSLYVLLAGEHGTELRRSDDGGHTAVSVRSFSAAEAVTDVAVDPRVAPSELYAASAAGVLRSRDGGATWTNAGGPAAWGAHRLRIRHLWTDPTSPRHLFVAPADGGLFETRLSD